MNDFALVRKNLWRKPVRTILLIISITIAFLILSLSASVSIMRSLTSTRCQRGW